MDCLVTLDQRQDELPTRLQNPVLGQLELKPVETISTMTICFLIMGNFSCKDSKRKVMNQVFSKENIFFFTRLIEIFVPLYHERINRWEKWRNRHG